MPDIRERLNVFNHLEPPELWTEAQLREPRSPVNDEPSPAKRIGVIAIAFVIAAAGIGFVMRAKSVAPPPVSSSSPVTIPRNSIVFGSVSSDRGNAPEDLSFVQAAGGPVTSLGVVPQGDAAGEAAWSPDGDRLAFIMGPAAHVHHYAGDGDLYILDLRTWALSQITTGLAVSTPSWSPDGSQIVVVDGQGEALATMDADGTNRVVIARSRGYYERPSWSPDGSLIAFQSVPTPGNIDRTAIFTIRPDGSGERQLTNGTSSEGFPAWSPDGRLIAYAAADRLWTMSSDGSNPHPLTGSRCGVPCVFDFAPSWSPDGQHIAFVRQEEGGAARRLYVLEIGTGRTRLLTPGAAGVDSPAWRPAAPIGSRQPTQAQLRHAAKAQIAEARAVLRHLRRVLKRERRIRVLAVATGHAKRTLRAESQIQVVLTAIAETRARIASLVNTLDNATGQPSPSPAS
jgi:dipeptidyl aminopeptidase/acylaminoacyl peptidase